MNSKNGQRVKQETSSGAFLVNEATLQFINQFTPFGGVGASGYGRCHGYEGFKQCSNQKSIMIKPTLNFFPFTALSPPYTKTNQKVLRLMMKYLDYTQCQLARRFVIFVIVIWLLWAIVTQRLTVKKLRKYKNAISMGITMMRQM